MKLLGVTFCLLVIVAPDTLSTDSSRDKNGYHRNLRRKERKKRKIEICHVPPDNPHNYHTITINANALHAHQAHGDLLGSCNENCATLCDDQNACTIDDTADCEDVGCPVIKKPLDCDDQLACTRDTCDREEGCLHNEITCTPSDRCHIAECVEPDGVCQENEVVCPTGYVCDIDTGECEEEDTRPDPEDVISNCWLEYEARDWLGESWYFVKLKLDVTALPPNSAEWVRVAYDVSFTRFYIIESHYVMFGYKTDYVSGETQDMEYHDPPLEVTLYDDFDHIDEFYTTIDGKLWSPLPNYSNFNIHYTVTVSNSNGGTYSEEFDFFIYM